VVGFKLKRERVVLGREIGRNGRKLVGDALELSDLVHRRACIMLGCLHEGLCQANNERIGLPVRLFMVVAEDGFEALWLDKIGEPLNVLNRNTALDQHGSR